jgi:hypothetical protein
MSPFLRVWARWLIPILLFGIGPGSSRHLAYVPRRRRSDLVARWEGGHAWVQERLSLRCAVSLRAQEHVYGRPAI